MRNFCLILLSLLAGSPLFSQNKFTYDHPQKTVKIGKYLRFYEDKEHKANYSFLRQLPEKAFTQSQQSVLNFGAVQSKFWLKMDIENNTSEPLFLLCDEENIFHLEVFTVDVNDSVSYAKTGYDEPYSTRFFENNQLTLPLGKTPKTLYIGISGNASLLASLYIASSKPLAAWFHLSDTFEGAFLGWMLLVLLYNLFIYFQLRDSLYLFYCLYVVSSTFLAIRLEGLGFDLFWQNHYRFNEWIDIPGAINTMIVVIFAMRFLQTKAILPRFHRVLQLFLVVVGCLPLLELWNIRPLSNNAVMMGFLVGSVLLWSSAFAAYRKGFSQARFYLLGWTTFIAGSILLTLWKLGVIEEDNPWIYNSFYIGMMIEAALFSFALADRIRIYRREADDARSLALQRLEENETLLLKHTLVLEKNLRLEQEGLKQPNVAELTQRMEQERGQIKRLSVPSMEGVLLLPLPDIIRLQALGSYCTIYLSHNKKIMASKPLADFEPFLTANGFFRVHKSHLINLHHVQRYVKGDGGTAIMSDGSEVNVSRGGKTGLMERLEIQ